MRIFALFVIISMIISYGRCRHFGHEAESDNYGGWLNILGLPFSVIYRHKKEDGSEPDVHESEIKIRNKAKVSEYNRLHGGFLYDLIGITLFRNVDQYLNEGQTKNK
ncbi:hypothetical protein L9F63_027212 [Diploptera punctata]|uniref:Uncharacterized protein n=1 Tax=Diploptera punctata TaxID=6984 RepID=A0AAD8ABY6_DIPPU|nr:hypothetical protein L9F63_027212 [Diploptera punctata]